jgi:hypothetical protein
VDQQDRQSGWRPTRRQSSWRPTRRRVFWTGVVVGLALLIVVICGYLFELKWTGLPKQTLWDWLDLLIVPAVLAVGGYLFTRSENQSTQAAAERRAQDDALQAYLQRVAMILTHANHSFVNACRASPSKRFCVADCEAGQLHCKPL